jgi:hypothetical protein
MAPTSHVRGALICARRIMGYTLLVDDDGYIDADEGAIIIYDRLSMIGTMSTHESFTGKCAFRTGRPHCFIGWGIGITERPSKDLDGNGAIGCLHAGGPPTCRAWCMYGD